LGLPFIPDSCNKLQNILNIKCSEYEFDINQFVGCTLNKPEILFKRVPQDKLDELKSKFN
jgi:methionyl-tRNA synthetase